ncbi:MAG: VWA domain-containing protein [Spirochaetales bacterium]|nr:MAG: VWA domain-containing protein [Spirochaetales bacterium]
MTRAGIAFLISVALAVPSQADDLVIGPDDVRVEQRDDAGYHLYVREKPGLGSVLLTETTRDPSGKADNYAYRAEAWNPVNGDERRKLDGVFMDPAKGIRSLIDSTPEPDAIYGSAFHVFIPWIVAYGYEWTRNGREFISDGTFINIRAFAMPYADYAGAFRDNPFLLSVTQRPFERAIPSPVVPAPENQAAEPDLSAYMSETVEAFENIADSSRGVTEFSLGTADIVPTLARILDGLPGDDLDLVICLDTTDSMTDDIDAVKEALPRMVEEHTARFKTFRLGLVLYKDYFEEYVVNRFDFTSDPRSFTAAVASVKVRGGRDIPEAVYEALWEALTGYVWAAGTKAIVLIGDAPPHPLPRGRVDKSMVDQKALDLDVSISVIILPH